MIEDIVNKWNDWCKDKDEGWIYDMSDEFCCTLCRGELCEVFDYLKDEYEKENIKNTYRPRSV